VIRVTSGMRRASIVCSALALAGCVDTTSVTLRPLLWPTGATAGHVEPVACTLQVMQIADGRLDPSVLGQVGPREVLMPRHEQAWLRSIMSALGTLGIAVRFGPASSDPAPHIEARVTLERAWVESIATAEAASVVLKVEYLRHGVPIKSADYRGSADQLDWDDGSEPIQNMVDAVITQVLVKMAGDFRTVCRDARTARPASQRSLSGT
jgi:hypothetical protein